MRTEPLALKRMVWMLLCVVCVGFLEVSGLGDHRTIHSQSSR
ncbi:MAG TPA: hypothetical protein VK129_08515 [Terriglobales bacterium]|nr:hypothetical protein [Terriglobales bacterium]